MEKLHIFEELYKLKKNSQENLENTFYWIIINICNISKFVGCSQNLREKCIALKYLY
jgi:hypothetical protein